jgi:hypothetical protein
LTSARTATRTFDLQLAIAATLRLAEVEARPSIAEGDAFDPKRPKTYFAVAQTKLSFDPAYGCNVLYGSSA